MARKKNISKLYKDTFNNRPYTYVMSKQGRSLKGVPPKRLVSMYQGNMKKYDIFNNVCYLVTLEPCTISDAVLESVRVTVNRSVSKVCNKNAYTLKVVTYPHIILRQHKLPLGAGADRMSMGMRLAFGIPICRAANVEKQQRIIEVKFEAENMTPKIKQAVSKGRYKLPCKAKVYVGTV